MSSNQIPFLELGYQNNFLFSQAKSITKMTANGTAAKDYSVISQKDPEKDGIEMKVKAFC